MYTPRLFLLARPRLGRQACLFVCAGLSVATAQAETLTLRAGSVELTASAPTGACALRDRASGVVWRTAEASPRLGWVEGSGGGRRFTADLRQGRVRRTAHGLEWTFDLPPAQPAGWLRVEARPGADARTLEFTLEAAPALGALRVRLLDQLFTVQGEEAGAVVVPVRRGLLIPADSGRRFRHVFDTYAYEGCHLAMLGVLKRGAAALLTWRDPYVQVELESTLTEVPGRGPVQRLTPAVVLQGSARRLAVSLLGRGDHVAVGQAYRELARREGWWVPWSVKLAERPERASLLGASNFKLWSLLDRRMNTESTREERVTVNWTFDEAAQVAEHLKHDLELDRVLFLMGGWIHRGYDNQHPDILPAAPECGGNAGLADCVRRIRAVGYLPGLHDNYQDLYRDSPSWDEALLLKHPDGTPVRGGRWAGGQAWLTCSPAALGLAQRPQNLPAVHQLVGDLAYFIDTTYASGLLECFDPQHPLTRHGDLFWKQALSDYARSLFGVFGSECGREWAIPHSDFFEGLTGVSGRHLHNAELEARLGAVSVPLFELVYRECIAAYGKYGYDIRQAAGYVLDHLVLGRPLHYHQVPPHLYWRQPAAGEEDLTPLIGEFEPAGPRRFWISYRWQVRRTPARDWRVFVHFTTSDGQIVFQDDHDPATPTSQWNRGMMEFGSFGREVPAALRGVFDLRMGLYDPATGRRALLPLQDDGEQRYLVGRLVCSPEGVRLETAAPAAPLAGDPAVFVRGDGGWTEGLHPLDRFVKNTHEVLAPLHGLTAQSPLTAHQFLTADRRVQRSVFGQGRDAVAVTVNAREGLYPVASAWGGVVELPRFGFLVESPRFVAFHATTWGGRRYAGPVLFTLRSLDNQPLSRSARVRVFHGWGEPEVRLGSWTFTVRREAVVSPGR